MAMIAGLYPAVLFVYGDPEVGRTAAAMLGLVLLSLAYVAVGAFASSLTRNQLIAFITTLALILILGMMLPFIVELGVVGTDSGGGASLAGLMRYMSTGSHFEQLLNGLVDTADLVYFGVMIGIFLLLTKTIVESGRWR